MALTGFSPALYAELAVGGALLPPGESVRMVISSRALPDWQDRASIPPPTPWTRYQRAGDPC